MNNERNNAAEIATTIRQQIGGPACVMIGAKNFSFDKDGSLTFKIGRNAKKVTHIKVALDPSDTYTMTFTKVGRAPKYTIVDLATVSDVYCDQLRPMIEAHTGMYTSL